MDFPWTASWMCSTGKSSWVVVTGNGRDSLDHLVGPPSVHISQIFCTHWVFQSVLKIDQRLAKLYVKDQIINIVDFKNHMRSLPCHIY